MRYSTFRYSIRSSIGRRPFLGDDDKKEGRSPRFSTAWAWKGAIVAALLLFAVRSASPQAGDGAPVNGDAVACAQLIYAGDRSANAFSDRFLQRTAQATAIRAEPHFRAVRLDSPALFDYPFALLSGAGDFSLTAQERTNLRAYLKHGGFLLASAGCSDVAWARSFREEFARLFPGAALAPLPRRHPLYEQVYRIDSLARTDAPQGQEAVLQAFRIGGRITLIFSPVGLNADPGCNGAEIARSEFVNVNLLAYALLH